MPKYDLSFSTQIMNAAGSLGFAPDPDGPVDLRRLGAFITNPVSLAPRTPAHGSRLLPYPGGLLLHTGFPNPGLKAVLRRAAARWGRSPAPVWVHVLSSGAGEVSEIVRRLEKVEGVMGIELGLPPGIDVEAALRFVQSAAGELPLVVQLPFERAVDLAEGLARSVGKSNETGIDAISLAPPRGALPGHGDGLVHGRLYGPAVFPLALAVVQVIVRTGIPVIGSGGVYRLDAVDAMLAAGAIAVQLDTVLWRGGFASERSNVLTF
jgi:dihydroorotate dehydrogenase (NAD+) catalytic subunit